MEHLSNDIGDDPFNGFADSTHAALLHGLEVGGDQLFVVNVDEDLYDIYLRSFPEEHRQYHTCSCCKDFIRRFGNLACIDEAGDIVSAVWGRHSEDDIYNAVDAALQAAVEKGTIVSAFRHHASVWGTPTAGGFTHFALHPPRGIPARTESAANKKIGELNENYRILKEAMDSIKEQILAQAIEVLKTGAFSGQERVVAGAEWLLKLYDLRRTSGGRWDNVLRREASIAPTGWCHPRSSMIGTLLDDLTAGLALDDAKRRWDAKMHPLRYARPQAAPSFQTIQRAEQIVKDLGIERSLERRYARLDELTLIWQPDPRVSRTTGVFSGVAPKNEPVNPALELNDKVQRITWVRFVRDVLPRARKIEVLAKNLPMNLGAIVTAAHADAPPILQWDQEEDRRPFSMYVYHGGSDASRWNLRRNTWVEATGITLHPAYWNPDREYTKFTRCACILLDGCVDTERGQGLALFPTTLRSELHEVRSVIEAFSQKGRLTGRESASACGVWVGSTDWSQPIRVSTDTLSTIYNIDRWE